MRFLLSALLSVMSVSVSASSSGPVDHSTVNRAGGWGHVDMSLEAGRYEPQHAHQWGTMAEATPGGKAPHFTYSPFDLEAGPSKWATNFPTAQCGGLKQSPIQLPSRENAVLDMNLSPLFPSYDAMFAPNTLSLRNTGHALQVDIPNGLSLTGGAVGTNPYTVLQMHMHGKSEHSMVGAHYPLEIHIVHRDETRAATDPKLLSVVGIMVHEHPQDKANPALEPFTSLLSPTFDSSLNNMNTSMKINKPFQLSKLLPYNLDYYHYSGSLTTPPCSEQVVWHVLATPITASRAQILALLAPFGDVGNARPPQPLNGRPVAATWFQTPVPASQTPAATTTAPVPVTPLVNTGTGVAAGKCTNTATTMSYSLGGIITLMGVVMAQMQ